MPEEQEYIYYATGDSTDQIDKLPQTERVSEAGYEILYFTEDVDEFAIQMMREYDEIEFKSVSSGDLGLDDEAKEEAKQEAEEHKEQIGRASCRERVWISGEERTDKRNRR